MIQFDGSHIFQPTTNQFCTFGEAEGDAIEYFWAAFQLAGIFCWLVVGRVMIWKQRNVDPQVAAHWINGPLVAKGIFRGWHTTQLYS